MALVDNGVKVSVPSILIPTGSSTQVVTEFTDFEYTTDLTLSVLKATVENVSKPTTFDNIIDDVAIGIKKQVSDIMGADYDDAAKTVTFYTEYLTINNNTGVSVDTDFYNNVAESYVCKVKVFIKTS